MFLKKMLFANGFSFNFIDTYLGKQLRKIMCPNVPKTTVNRAVVYFPISFMGKKSFSFKNNLTRLLNEFYPQLNIRVIFKPNRTIGSLFKLKDRVPIELQASAIYKYQCGSCNATYIGKSKRQIRVRQFELLGRSIRTNRPLGKPSFSAIHQHAEEKDHPVHLDNFSVLTSRSNEMELSTVETLYIIKEKPSLCNNERSVELLCF